MENRFLSLIVNRVSEHPSAHPGGQLNWSGMNVTYLRTAFSRYPLHQHRAVQIAVPLRTSGFTAVALSATGSRREPQNLTGDNVFIVPAEQPHTILWQQDTEFVMFDLEPEFVERAAGESFRGNRVEIKECSGVRDAFISQLGIALFAEFSQSSAIGRIYVESLAATLAIHLLRNYSATAQNVREFSGGLSGAKLRRAIDYIDANLDQDLSLPNIAEKVGMSPYYFSRALKKSTGFTPHAYVVRQRVERAKQLLVKTRMPIIDIALAVGFVNHSHFSTQFGKLVGSTPKSYREA